MPSNQSTGEEVAIAFHSARRHPHSILESQSTMKIARVFSLTLGLLLFHAGCSQDTLDDAQEAGQATGEMISNAAEDTVENAEDAARSIDDAVDTEGDANLDAAAEVDPIEAE